MKRIRYLFPKTDDFRETRPVICWEHMYGWIDGYGLLFDPLVLNETRMVPESENGWNRRVRAGDFIIACCHQASDAIGRPPCAGLYVRPAQGPDILKRGRVSEKERIRTPWAEYFYPVNLPFDRYAGSAADDWQIGESPALARVGQAVGVAYEFFAAVAGWNGEWPERRLLEGAQILLGLLAAAGAIPSGRPATAGEALADLRLDFQAYGVNRLLVQWFLEKKGRPRTAVKPADAAMLQAAAAWARGDAAGVKRALKTAFETLAALRRRHSQLELHFMEFPHMGLLLEDKGFFELEWPEGARETMLSYLAHCRERGYKLSIEGGGNCWGNLATRFPQLAARIRQAWQAGDVDLTNGTQTLPYAIVSPLALQYWQFRVGGESFRRLFGRPVQTYQCQENSLTPQMPELLLHFGYPRALHITQNRGQAPGEDVDFIWWQSPGGHRLPAMTTRHPALGRKGNNFFHDLPLVHDEYGRQAQSLNYVNFQDLGYVPYRGQMIRAHRYAPVWGTFGLAEARFAAAFDPAAAPARTHGADDYRFSQSAYYNDETNVNALSQYEMIYGLNARLRETQILSYVAGRWPRQRRRLEALLPALLLTEAHDVVVVQGQRVGEHHRSNTMVTGPCSRNTLSAEVAKINRKVGAALAEARAELGAGRGGGYFNAGEVELPFARVSEALSGAKHLIAVGAHRYAVGPFKPLTTGRAAAVPDTWRPVALPFRAGRWSAGMDATGCVELAWRGRRILVLPKDARHGAFEPVAATASRCGALHRLEVLYRMPAAAGFHQSATLTVLLTADSPLAEVAVAYAPGRVFAAKDRWSDRLSLSFGADGAFSRIVRFNPNVYADTAEDRIASPCCLTAETAAGPLTLLNEGALFYEADRRAGRLDWSFHVAGETVLERRMALLLDEGPDAFQLARAWSRGVVALACPAKPWFGVVEGWDKLSVETLTAAREVLVSNLDDAPRTFTFDAGDVASAVDAEGRKRLRRAGPGRVQIDLQSYELAFLKLKTTGTTTR